MNKFKKGDVCVIHSRTSHHNGNVVTVEKYPNKKRKDIVTVRLRKRKFQITEESLTLASDYDIIRSMNDRKLRKFLNSIKNKGGYC